MWHQCEREPVILLKLQLRRVIQIKVFLGTSNKFRHFSHESQFSHVPKFQIDKVCTTIQMQLSLIIIIIVIIIIIESLWQLYGMPMTSRGANFKFPS